MQAHIYPLSLGTTRVEPATRAVPEIRKRSRSRRAVYLSWLRKTHLYVGLWGALLIGIWCMWPV
jgi:hypothetical protein